MALTPGTRLGVYEIVSALGAGGMGEVYRARDSRLKREVALKVLLADVANDRERLARFQREAEVLAALNHPHIAHIHGIEESNGTIALVMELVDGEDLSQWIARGAIPLDEALPIAQQIAEALDAAHEQGIVHRDLKPANIKVRPDGTVKVLDFGLAKALDQGPGSLADSPTITSPAMTMRGVILGTAAYMAPEQARGKAVDKRADIWAFGIVLYEMLTGRRPFEGETITDVLSAVVRAEPDWTALPATTPRGVRRLLQVCLQKDPVRRLRDVGDVHAIVEDEGFAPIVGSPPRRWLWPSVSAALLIGLLALLGLAALGPVRRATVVTVRFLLPPPVDTVFGVNRRGLFEVSPDGQYVAFLATTPTDAAVWIQALSSLTARKVPDSDGANGAPFWSPDSRELAYFAGGALKKFTIASGESKTLCEVPLVAAGTFTGVQAQRRGTWGTAGTIVISLGALYSVAEVGGRPTEVTSPQSSGHVRHSFPHFLPDGRQFIFHAVSAGANQGHLYAGSLDGGPPTKILDVAGPVLFVEPDLLMMAEPGAGLMVQPFDWRTLQVRGERRPLGEAVVFDGQADGWSAAKDVLAYTSGVRVESQFTWVDRTGRDIGTVGDTASHGNFDLSPDGKWLATSRRDPQTGDLHIWTMDLVRGTMTRLTSGKVSDSSPVWSPDGQRLAFFRRPTSQIQTILARGGNEIELGSGGPVDDWSPDGTLITFNRSPSVMAIPVQPGGKPYALIDVPTAHVDESHFSPDGRWIAYNSNESGAWQVYVATFPPTPGQRWQVSVNGGSEGRWRSDGREFYFLSLSGQLMAVDIAAGLRFQAGVPRMLFQTGVNVNPQEDLYAVSNDGQRFLIPKPTLPGSRYPLTVVLNWRDGEANRTTK